MDKLKQRAKRKRRIERERAAAEADKKLAAEFNAYYEERGMKHDFTTEQVVRGYREVQRESLTTAIMADIISTLLIMRRKCRYGNRRLCRLAASMMQRASWVGNNERSIKQLDEELRLDAKLNCADYWTGKPNINRCLRNGEYQRRDAALRTAPHVFPIPMHAVYYELFKNPVKIKSAKLEAIASEAGAAAKRAIEENLLDSYIAELMECGFKIDMRGRFGGKDVSQDEFNKYNRLLKL